MSENIEKNGFISSIIKASALAIIVSLVGVLIFALVLTFTDLDSSVIKPVNQFIKILSVFLGCFFFVKENAGLIKGLFVGVIATALVYVIYSFLGTSVKFNISFFIDLAFMAIIGGICGIISVNVKKD